MPTMTRAREVVIVVIGVITPVGILAVNASAFVMQHLAQARVSLAGAALVSALLLNGLVGYSAIRWSRRNAPLLYAEYKRVVWVALVLGVALSAYIAAYFTYVGMQDAKQLPSGIAILASFWALLTPFAITYIERRFLRRREAEAEKGEERDAARERTPTRSRAPR
jgi:hypothetical protein